MSAPRQTAADAVEIVAMTEADWPAVARIYGEGIAPGNATFETVAPDWPAWDAGHRPDCRLIARAGGEALGFFALAPYSTRQVYRGVAWESVYVAAAARGRGIGRLLVDAGCRAAQEAGLWALIAGIMDGNLASIALHERAGFRMVGTLERIGQDIAGLHWVGAP